MKQIPAWQATDGTKFFTEFECDKVEDINSVQFCYRTDK